MEELISYHVIATARLTPEELDGASALLDREDWERLMTAAALTLDQAGIKAVSELAIWSGNKLQGKPVAPAAPAFPRGVRRRIMKRKGKARGVERDALSLMLYMDARARAHNDACLS